MALDTSYDLRRSVIYCVYVRNFSQEGTFAGVIPQLDRLKSLGVD